MDAMSWNFFQSVISDNFPDSIEEIFPSHGVKRIVELVCEEMCVRIMPSLPSFSSISPIYYKTSCPKHDVKRHNYALTITTTTRGTSLRSRYPVLVIIRELEDSTSRPSVAS